MVRTASTTGFHLVGHHDLGGCGDGMQVMRLGDALYVGHLGTSGMGTSILDVSDPSAPALVRAWHAPANTHTHKVQVADGLLLVNHEIFPYGSHPPEGEFSAGLAVYSLNDPFSPTPLGFWRSGGRGVHRVVYEGGRYAYLSATPEGFTDRIWVIVDLADPASPREVGRWWWPGQWAGGGEEPSWPGEMRVAAHHALLDGEIAYLGYDDMNLVVLDVSQPSRPTLVSNLRWDEGGSTHTCLPLPGRRLVVATDEQLRTGSDAGPRRVRVIDVADPAHPRVVGVCPEPDEAYKHPRMRFGSHNLHENRAGSYRSERLIFATYFSGGLRVYDIKDPSVPREVGHWVPEAPPGQPAPQSNDLFVDTDGLVYVTDRVGGGLAVLEPEGWLRELMAEAAL